MAQSIEAGAVVELTMFSEYQGQVCMNVFHYNNSGLAIASVDGDAELTNLIEQFDNVVWDPALFSIKGRLVETFVLKYLRAQVVHPTRQYYVEAAVDEGGDEAVAGIPSDTNLTLSLRTAGAERGMTGNKKFTGLPTSQFSGNIFDPAQYAAWYVVASHIRATLTDLALTDRWVPIVWSPARSGDRRTIIAHTVQPQVRVLRRRQKGLGI